RPGGHGSTQEPCEPGGMGAACVTGLASILRAAVARTQRAVGAVTGQVAMWLAPDTALIVPVLEAEPAVAAWLGKQKVTFHGAPLHVTVMYPCLPARSVTAADE